MAAVADTAEMEGEPIEFKSKEEEDAYFAKLHRVRSQQKQTRRMTMMGGLGLQGPGGAGAAECSRIAWLDILLGTGKRTAEIRRLVSRRNPAKLHHPLPSPCACAAGGSSRPSRSATRAFTFPCQEYSGTRLSSPAREATPLRPRIASVPHAADGDCVPAGQAPVAPAPAVRAITSGAALATEPPLTPVRPAVVVATPEAGGGAGARGAGGAIV